MFVKPTDSHSYLNYFSCHPQTIKSSIPYSQFLRMKRNCTEQNEFIKHSVQLLSFLSLRGYSPNLTIPALHRCNNFSQCEALLPKEKSESYDNSLFCITEFKPLNPPIHMWIHELWPILYRSCGTRMLVDKRIIFGHSFQDILVHTNIFGEKRFVNKPSPCNRKWKCKHCPRMRSKILISCNSKNPIYVIECQICKIQYVGQTKNKILTQIKKTL